MPAGPSTRVGDAERADAQRALQQHLDAGRLRLGEFVERFGRAADAVTAADLAALFADLPPPHPELPGPPVRRARRSLVAVGALVALALVGLLGFAIGRGQSAPAQAAVAAPSVPAAPTESVLPGRPTVRRSTGPGLITLHPSDGVDLDDVSSPTWSLGTGGDIGFAADASRLSIDDGHAVVTGPLQFATCLHEPTYAGSAIARGDLQPGQIICVRTSAHRLAVITVVSASAQAVEFGATVWDPPIPS